MSFHSLYVHFPFCETKCHYCDFYSIGAAQTGPQDSSAFSTALNQEAKLWSEVLGRETQGGLGAHSFETIFFGGGTPSMTPPDQMEKALRPLQISSQNGREPETPGSNPTREWTMEANPSSIERNRMREYRALGVNRVSMGVQALRDDLLKDLGRVHDGQRAFDALEEVFSAGFENVSVDLLCGVPGQSIEELTRTMERLTEFPITHLSCYLLTLPKGHRMYKNLPSEEGQLEHLLTIDSFMRSKGFDHYEISNFARLRPGLPKSHYRAHHNMSTWRGRGYLGLGPSAHSFNEASKERFKNVSSLHGYAARLSKGERPIEWTEALTAEQLKIEAWMLGLRLSDGIEKSFVEKEQKSAHVEKLKDQGLMEAHPEKPNRVRLTARGFALSDQVIRFLI